MRLRRWFYDPEDDGLIAAAKKEGRLTVIGLPRDWCGCGVLIDSFKAKYGLAVTDFKPDAASAGQLEALKASRNDRTLPAPDVIDVGLSFGSAAKMRACSIPTRYRPGALSRTPPRILTGSGAGTTTARFR